MSRKGETITLSLSAQQKEQLEQIALGLGQTWGEEPNISKLIRSIADGELQVILADEKEADSAAIETKSLMTNKQRRNSTKAAIIIIQEGLAKLIKSL